MILHNKQNIKEHEPHYQTLEQELLPILEVLRSPHEPNYETLAQELLALLNDMCPPHEPDY